MWTNQVNHVVIFDNSFPLFVDSSLLVCLFIDLYLLICFYLLTYLLIEFYCWSLTFHFFHTQQSDWFFCTFKNVNKCFSKRKLFCFTSLIYWSFYSENIEKSCLLCSLSLIMEKSKIVRKLSVMCIFLLLNILWYYDIYLFKKFSIGSFVI